MVWFSHTPRLIQHEHEIKVTTAHYVSWEGRRGRGRDRERERERERRGQVEVDDKDGE